MNKRHHLLVILVFFFSTAIISQPLRQPDGGGAAPLPPAHDEISAEQRNSIATMLQQNIATLRSEGKLPIGSRPLATLFEWPLRQRLGINDKGYYLIGNYVDDNTGTGILDYMCSDRTYDGHMGTDIGLWPFQWQKMERNEVEIISGANGIIIGKYDGNYDQSCSFCTSCSWNAVYVMHVDGSIAWYGHMKTGTLTGKSVGSPVTTGEYLGVVGSSGYSTGPHLHFELHTNENLNQLINPWAGPCNIFNGNTSWWANQQPYYVPTLNKVMVHGDVPVHSQCAPGESVKEQLNFFDGDTVYLMHYFRDQRFGDGASHKIFQPNNVLWQEWTSSSQSNYIASWWYWYWYLPNPAMAGTWRYEVIYNGEKTVSWFAVNSADLIVCGENYYPLVSNLSGTTNKWQVNTGSGFVDINDNSYYSGTNTTQLQLLKIPSSFYGYQYRCKVNTTTFSRVITLKFVSYWQGGKSKRWEDPVNWSCGYVPDAYTDIIIEPGALNDPELNSNGVCRTITVKPGGFLKVNPGYNLTVTK